MECEEKETMFDSIGKFDGKILHAKKDKGLVGQALVFEKGVSLVEHAVELNPEKYMTIEAIVNAKENKTAKIAQKGDWDGHGIGQDIWRGWSCSYYVDGVGKVTVYFDKRPNLGEWYHLACVFDSTKVILYVNGRNVAEEKVEGKLRQNTRPFSVGSDAGSQKFFVGMIDEVAVYNEPLEEEIVKNHAKKSLSGKNYCEEETSCFGTAVDCSFFGSQSACIEQDGCAWSEQCNGFCTDCNAFLTEIPCNDQNGCSWIQGWCS